MAAFKTDEEMVGTLKAPRVRRTLLHCIVTMILLASALHKVVLHIEAIVNAP